MKLILCVVSIWLHHLMPILLAESLWKTDCVYVVRCPLKNKYQQDSLKIKSYIREKAWWEINPRRWSAIPDSSTAAAPACNPSSPSPSQSSASNAWALRSRARTPVEIVLLWHKGSFDYSKDSPNPSSSPHPQQHQSYGKQHLSHYPCGIWGVFPKAPEHLK